MAVSISFSLAYLDGVKISKAIPDWVTLVSATESGNTYDVRFKVDSGYTFEGGVCKAKYPKKGSYIADTEIEAAYDESTGVYRFYTTNGSTSTSPFRFYVQGNIYSGATPPASIVNNIANTEATINESDNVVNITLTPNSGYLLDTATAAYEDSSGVTQTKSFDIVDGIGSITVTDYKGGATFTIDGTTKYTDLNITYSGEGASMTYTRTSLMSVNITVKADSGRKITRAIINYNEGSSSTTHTKTLDILSDGSAATGTLTSVYLPNSSIRVYAETEEVTPTIDIINHIEGGTLNYSEDGTTLRIQVLVSGSLRRIKNSYVTYTDNEGTVKREEMTNSYSSSQSQATATITDCDTSKQVNVYGDVITVVQVIATLTNCTLNTGDYVEPSTATEFVVTAYANCQFDSAPTMVYTTQTGTRVPVTFTVSADKKTASYTLDTSTCSYLEITATAAVVEPVSTGYGSVYTYKVSEENLDSFAKSRFFEITKGDTETGITYQEIDLGDYVASIKRLYVDVPVDGAATLQFGNYSTNIKGENPSSLNVNVTFEPLTLPEYTNDSHDNSNAYTLFLPFIGMHQISGEYHGKQINVEYVVDVVSASAVCNVYVEGTRIFTQLCEPSQSVLYRTSTYNISTVGETNWRAEYAMGLTPKLWVEHTSVTESPYNNDNTYCKVGECSGYNRFNNITGLKCEATQNEITEILQLLQSGVIL